MEAAKRETKFYHTNSNSSISSSHKFYHTNMKHETTKTNGSSGAAKTPYLWREESRWQQDALAVAEQATGVVGRAGDDGGGAGDAADWSRRRERLGGRLMKSIFSILFLKLISRD